MSYDLQVLSIVDDLEVVSITEVATTPRTVRVVGRQNFFTAQRVEILGVALETFTVVSERIMLLEVGNGFAQYDAEDLPVVVYSSEFTGKRRVRLSMTATNRMKNVVGFQKLVQQVLIALLSDPGTNRFAPSTGGGMLAGLGNALSEENRASLAAGIAQAVTAAATQITSVQATQRLPSSERLLKLELSGISFDLPKQEVSARISLRSYAGQSIDLPVVL